MSFDLQQIETQLSLLEWRNTQLEAITGQLESAFPSLMDMIETKVAEMSLIKVAQAQINPKTLAESVIAPWAEEQGHIALKRAEEGLSKIVTSLQADVELGEHLRAALPALAGVGVIATSVLGLPAVVSFATLTSTSFLFLQPQQLAFRF